MGAGADAPPDGALAAALAAAATGCEPIAVERFTTGLQHYVFETRFVGRAPVVVRIAAEHGRAAMIGAAKLSGMLRPLGVSLPRSLRRSSIRRFRISCWNGCRAPISGTS